MIRKYRAGANLLQSIQQMLAPTVIDGKGTNHFKIFWLPAKPQKVYIAKLNSSFN